jgi:uncharacterized membrane protein YgcG
MVRPPRLRPGHSCWVLLLAVALLVLLSCCDTSLVSGGVVIDSSVSSGFQQEVSDSFRRHRTLPGGNRGGRDGDRARGGPRGGDDQQNNDGGSSQGSGSSSRNHHSSHTAYGDVHRKQFRHYYTSLGDVLFCFVMALAWTVWLLSSFIKSDLRKYQHESVLVRGHVLQVSVEDDSLGTGIPTYKAIIDYMVPPVSEVPIHPAACSAHAIPLPPLVQQSKRTSEEGGSSGGTARDATGSGSSENHARSLTSEPGSIQIRKEFETSHLLTEGFANVELLVLPHEPTYSVIKEDFERDYAMHQHQQRSIAFAAAAAAQNGGPHPTSLLVRSNTMGGISTLSANNNTIAHESMIDVLFEDLEWWRSPWFRRMSVAGAGMLVLASVAGGIQVVTRLRPSQRCWGWVMVVVGVPLLLPAAIGIHYGLRKVRRVFESKSAMIVRGAERLAVRPCSSSCEDMMDARGCDDEDVTIVTSPTRATSAADGCYIVRVNNHRKSKTENVTSFRPKPLAYGAQSPSKSAAASCLPPPSPRGGAANTTLPTQVELDRESSRGDTSASSVSTVSSVSMQER